MGVAGIIALLTLYLVPLVIAVHQIRTGCTGVAAGAPWAAGMLVATYMVSGLTQSMFAHALSTSAYVVLLGLLLGIGMRNE
jgi:O-antigen ligase